MTIKNNDKVTLDYEGRLDDGTIFDSSKHGDHSHPLEFVVGSGMVIPGFDKAVLGMKKDEEKEFSIEPKDAYGEYNSQLKKDIPKKMLVADGEVEKGSTIMVSTNDGRQFPVVVDKVSGDNITLDFNHPLAGKKLIFKIKIVDIK
ncbi:MAG: peptidylprolyl isomerase [Candidatus Pacearchaeota archaeon]|jgi:FKBP-type peptidyl-prolyl cis-trans isomerase 2